MLFTFLLAAAVTAAPELSVQIIYDNTSAREGIEADWGFAALVRYQGRTVLFDSGTKPDLFLTNLKKLNIDPSSITHAVISHEHGDHRNGIYALYKLNPKIEVSFLDNFAAPAFDQASAVGMNPRRINGPAEIVPGIYTTGIVDGSPPEQALVIETSKGLVMLTGCSHPGVVRLVEAAEKQRGRKSVRFLLGGFHLLQDTDAQVTEKIASLQRLGVASIAATHCTGDRAIALFREAYGKEFRAAGAGQTFSFD
jgi:7,8-dihydropterin-6-yl-methyl-4-(beta-D-ribofuranosyl)aminobenzene 5'-phosphate synthase